MICVCCEILVTYAAVCSSKCSRSSEWMKAPCAHMLSLSCTASDVLHDRLQSRHISCFKGLNTDNSFWIKVSAEYKPQCQASHANERKCLSDTRSTFLLNLSLCFCQQWVCRWWRVCQVSVSHEWWFTHVHTQMWSRDAVLCFFSRRQCRFIINTKPSSRL